MSVRSYVIQLQAGVGQALLPDHRKMLPGVQYVVDADTFSRISLGARQSVIKVVSVNTDSTSTSGTFYPAQTSTGYNLQALGGVSFQNILSQTSSTLSGIAGSFSIAGFAAQGASAGGGAGAGAGIGLPSEVLSGAANNYMLTGPDGARYTLVYNNTGTTISGGWSTVWTDYNNRFVGVAASGAALVVKQDGLGTSYVISSNVSYSGSATNNNGTVTSIGTKAGEFAGITLVNLPANNFGFIQVDGIHPNAAVASGTPVGTAVGLVSTNTNGTLAAPTNTTPSVSSTLVVSGTALANNIAGTVLTTPASGTGTGQFFAQVELRSRRVKKPYVRFLNKN